MIRYSILNFVLVVAVALLLQPSTCSAAPHADGELRIEITDAATGQPVAARMHLYAGRNPNPSAMTKRAIKLNIPGSAEYGGHFYIDSKATLPLRVGVYTFELEAGPEYLTQSGQFEIERHADDTKEIEMKRVTDLAKEGWYGGDVDVRRNKKDLPLILRAEGLTIAPISRRSGSAGEQQRGKGAEQRRRRGGEQQNSRAAEEQNGREMTSSLLVFSSSPLEPQSEIRNPKSEIDIAPTPYAWDLPIWLTEGQLEGIELINPHSLRNGVVDNEKDGRPRDKSFFPGPRGNGRWSEAVYYHVLNCGFHIPPVAGSGSGYNDSPVGTNRVYVFCGNEYSPEAWWEGLKAGRVFVTNGPLLRPMVEGRPPGYTFPIDSSGSLTLEIGLNLATSVPVEYLQIVKNGVAEAEVRLAEFKDRKGRLPPLRFDDSGWFLVRAVTSNPKVLQFASSGPYYVEKGGRPRISRASVNFFIDWIDVAQSRLSGVASDRSANEPTLAKLKSAWKFFVDLRAKANAD